MAEPSDARREPRSVLLARDLNPDPHALAAVSLADFGPLARQRMHPAAYDYWLPAARLPSSARWRSCARN